jgi:hypothetical protein
MAAGAFIRTFDQRDLDQSGFTLKPSALLLSSFQVLGRVAGKRTTVDGFEQCLSGTPHLT